jgi:hypothetical protein
VSLRIPRSLRAACALMALAVYVLPMAVGVASRVSHDAQHVLELIRELESRAAAMGVAHLHDQVRFASVSIRGVESAPDDGFVHTHGGAPHAHDDGVGLRAGRGAPPRRRDGAGGALDPPSYYRDAAPPPGRGSLRCGRGAEPGRAALAAPSSPRLSPFRR